MNQGATSLKDYLDVVRRRKMSLIAPFAAIFLVSAAVAVILPPIYKSTSTILIEEQEIPADFVSPTDFCDAYAKAAVSQFNYAVAHGVPGILFPVWSDNFDHHYNWCLSVPRESAEQGAATRQSHIDSSSGTVKGAGLIAGSDHATPVSGKQIDAQVNQQGPSVTDRQLDPGLGP